MNKKQEKINIINTELKRLFPKAKTSLEFSNTWELLIAVSLSAQCTDAQVNKVTKKLFAKYKTLDDYINANINEFEQDIFSTGFYKNKTKNVLESAKILKNEFNGIVPNTINDLLKFKGVGKKTANVILGNAFGIVEGIAVDTHVIRLCKKHNITKSTLPKIIEQELMQLLPQEDWFNFTNRAIEYGRKFCPSKKHNHEQCPLVIALKKENLL